LHPLKYTFPAAFQVAPGCLPQPVHALAYTKFTSFAAFAAKGEAAAMPGDGFIHDHAQEKGASLFKSAPVKPVPVILRPPVRGCTIHARTISASYWSAYKRANYAARWVRGLITMQPTIKLAADVFGASLPYTHKEMRVLDGIKPPNPIVSAYLNASAEQKLEAARVIGVDRVWDEMISPVVS